MTDAFAHGLIEMTDEFDSYPILRLVSYAEDILGGRWPEAEEFIMQDSLSTFQYAVHVVKDRWTEAEPTLIQDPAFWPQYLSFLKEIGQDIDTWGVESW